MLLTTGVAKAIGLKGFTLTPKGNKGQEGRVEIPLGSNRGKFEATQTGLKYNASGTILQPGETIRLGNKEFTVKSRT